MAIVANMTSVRIVTINTAKGDFSYNTRIPWLAQDLVRLHPDIVLLQEALTTDGGELDTPRSLAEALQFRSLHSPARRKIREIGGVRYQSGTGLSLLSRLPFKETTVVPLPSDPADGERIGQLAFIDTETDRLLIGNLHLTYLRGEAADQMRRTELDVFLAHPWFERRWDACLIGGDFNAPLSALPALVEDHAPWDLRDAYLLGDGREPRATAPSTQPPENGQCIDYLFSLALVSKPHPAFTASAIVLDQEGPVGLLPSDHRGIATTMVLHNPTVERK